ncbi:P-loop containing nucleoside triphosphate hydrolase protein [Mycena galericulata]|nr:P-loop containing nucleoside triphosphate hydrolase protein [Mycena galericulata]
MWFHSLSAVLGLLSELWHTVAPNAKVFILLSLMALGRQVYQWIAMWLQNYMTLEAHFDEGDPAYEWILSFLTQENIGASSGSFAVNAIKSGRKWSLTGKTSADKGVVEIWPTYQKMQTFRWRGHWLAISRHPGAAQGRFVPSGAYEHLARLYVTILSTSISSLFDLMEAAHTHYVAATRASVIVHVADSAYRGSPATWSSAKEKVARPLSSVILESEVIEGLLRDVRKFLGAEEWYVERGIPYRRGYLLHGPPGTGKTSTVFALASEFHLEIYSLSLGSPSVDDSFLYRAISSIPKGSLLLLEDIDCALPSRDDDDDEPAEHPASMRGGGAQLFRGGFHGERSWVTLSGLLNAIDGVGSKEGLLVFATTNFVDRLDPALLRPGRIDRKIQYDLATRAQAQKIFLRLFPSFPVASEDKDTIHIPAAGVSSVEKTSITSLSELAAAFSAVIPSGEFSAAEIQCYLQGNMDSPVAAVEGAHGWVEELLRERREKEARKEVQKTRVRERLEKRTV